jgi:hypothetical protein
MSREAVPSSSREAFYLTPPANSQIGYLLIFSALIVWSRNRKLYCTPFPYYSQYALSKSSSVMVTSARASRALVVPVSMSATARTAVLQLLFHFLHSRPVTSHDISYMSDAIKVYFQLVNLPQYIMKPLDFLIRHLNRISGSIVLLLSHHRRLIGQVF